MIKIKEQRFLHTCTLFEYKLENNDTLYLTYNELGNLINNGYTDETFYSLHNQVYIPVLNDKEYSDDPIMIIGFNTSY